MGGCDLPSGQTHFGKMGEKGGDADSGDGIGPPVTKAVEQVMHAPVRFDKYEDVHRKRKAHRWQGRSGTGAIAIIAGTVWGRSTGKFLPEIYCRKPLFTFQLVFPNTLFFQ